ncbi:MAG: hypothetical protein AAF211_17980, partial [Myxococcota bacterium]
LLRHVGEPRGTVDLTVALRTSRNGVLDVVESDLPVDGQRVTLATTQYREGAPRLWEHWPR